MIDEKKLIEDLQTLADKEGEACDGAARLHLHDVVEKYNHGEYCYVKAIEAVRKQPKVSEWIPCSERLPEANGEYICTQEIHSLSTGKIIGESVELVEFYGGGWMRAKHLKVIAWQPLPDPYIGG